MGFQRTKLLRGRNAGSYTISFYCKNKDCLRHKPKKATERFGKPLPKSIHLKYLTAHIAWTLKHLTKNTEKAYKQYIGRLEEQLKVDKTIAQRKVAEARLDLKKEQNNYSKYQILQRDDPEAYKKHHKGKLEEQQQIVTAKEATLAQAESELERVGRALPTEKQFVELTRSYLETLLKTKDLVEEDLVYREVVLNLRANDNFVSVIKLNPPYDMMVDFSENTIWSAQNDTQQTYLQDSLYGILRNHRQFRDKVEKLQRIVDNAVKPEGLELIKFV